MEENKLERNDSFASIPECDFMKDLIAGELREVTLQMSVSEFRRKEKEGYMKPEPLLIPDKSRFVLFPIKHTDVRPIVSITFVVALTFFILNTLADLGHVQKGRGVLLDSRRD